jgi:hypothetical protein
MDVPDVDVVRAETGEGGVERGEKMAAGAVETAVGVRDAACLGGDDEVTAGHQAVHQLPEQILRLAVPVHVGGVDKGAARLPEQLQHVRGVMLVRVTAPRQGTEPDPGHTQAGSAEMPLLHERRHYWPEFPTWGPVDNRFPGARTPEPLDGTGRTRPTNLPPPGP